MKSYLTSFMTTGTPNSHGDAPTWDLWSAAEATIELTTLGVGMIPDPNANNRCVFWQANATP